MTSRSSTARRRPDRQPIAWPPTDSALLEPDAAASGRAVAGRELPLFGCRASRRRAAHHAARRRRGRRSSVRRATPEVPRMRGRPRASIARSALDLGEPLAVDHDAFTRRGAIERRRMAGRSATKPGRNPRRSSARGSARSLIDLIDPRGRRRRRSCTSRCRSAGLTFDELRPRCRRVRCSRFYWCRTAVIWWRSRPAGRRSARWPTGIRVSSPTESAARSIIGRAICRTLVVDRAGRSGWPRVPHRVLQPRSARIARSLSPARASSAQPA